MFTLKSGKQSIYLCVLPIADPHTFGVCRCVEFFFMRIPFFWLIFGLFLIVLNDMNIVPQAIFWAWYAWYKVILIKKKACLDFTYRCAIKSKSSMLNKTKSFLVRKFSFFVKLSQNYVSFCFI